MHLRSSDTQSRLSLRGRGSPHPRGFRFSSASNTGESEAVHPDDMAPVPGSPLGSPRAGSPRALRGMPAGKLVEMFRAGLAWPHVRSPEAAARLRRSRSASPPAGRLTSPGRRWFAAAKGLPGSQVSSRITGASPHGEAALTPLSALDAAALTAAAAAADAAAEADANRHANRLSGHSRASALDRGGRSPSPPRPAPREQLWLQSTWREGLSPRTKERGALRLFPCQLLKVHGDGSAGALAAEAARATSPKRAGGVAPLPFGGARIGDRNRRPALPCSTIGTYSGSTTPTVIGPSSGSTNERLSRRLIPPSDSEGCSMVLDDAGTICSALPSPSATTSVISPSGGSGAGRKSLGSAAVSTGGRTRGAATGGAQVASSGQSARGGGALPSKASPTSRSSLGGVASRAGGASPRTGSGSWVSSSSSKVGTAATTAGAVAGSAVAIGKDAPRPAAWTSATPATTKGSQAHERAQPPPGRSGGAPATGGAGRPAFAQPAAAAAVPSTGGRAVPPPGVGGRTRATAPPQGAAVEPPAFPSAAEQAPASAVVSSSARLNELRGRLEMSLRTAEDRLSDMHSLDKRLQVPQLRGFEEAAPQLEPPLPEVVIVQEELFGSEVPLKSNQELLLWDTHGQENDRAA